jgi:hypothetical protein
LWEYALSAGFVSVRIERNPISTSTLEGIVDKRLLEMKEATNLLDVEPLLVEWNNLSFQIRGDGHAEEQQMTTRRIGTYPFLWGCNQIENKWSQIVIDNFYFFRIPVTYEKRCKSTTTPRV